jgi:hypothetical protein
MTVLNDQDVKLVGATPDVLTLAVKSGTTATVKMGDLIVVDASNAGYVSKAPNGASSTLTWVGVALGASDETTSADGTVDVRVSKAGLVVELDATTPSNLAQALIGTKVTLDVSGGVQKVDENDTSNGILTILSYASPKVKVLVPCTY